MWLRPWSSRYPLRASPNLLLPLFASPWTMTYSPLRLPRFRPGGVFRRSSFQFARMPRTSPCREPPPGRPAACRLAPAVAGVLFPPIHPCIKLISVRCITIASYRLLQRRLRPSHACTLPGAVARRLLKHLHRLHTHALVERAPRQPPRLSRRRAACRRAALDPPRRQPLRHSCRRAACSSPPPRRLRRRAARSRPQAATAWATAGRSRPQQAAIGCSTPHRT